MKKVWLLKERGPMGGPFLVIAVCETKEKALELQQKRAAQRYPESTDLLMDDSISTIMRKNYLTVETIITEQEIDKLF